MKEQLEVLGKLAGVRANKVRQILARVAYQRNLCQQYRNNIAGLERLCEVPASLATSLQRDNQQRYKATLHKMMELQQRELRVAEEALARVERELLQAMRSEKIVTHLIETRLAEWTQALAKQEQKLQDSLAAQTWWRNQASY